MSLPRKEKVPAWIQRPVQSIERSLNEWVATTSPSTAAAALATLSMAVAVLAGFFLYLNSSTITGVGAISSPTLLEHTTQALGDKSPLETLHEFQRTQAFLDSVEELGLERMEEIYTEKYQSPNHD